MLLALEALSVALQLGVVVGVVRILREIRREVAHIHERQKHPMYTHGPVK